jgi:hypothetical protein
MQNINNTHNIPHKLSAYGSNFDEKPNTDFTSEQSGASGELAQARKMCGDNVILVAVFMAMLLCQTQGLSVGVDNENMQELIDETNNLVGPMSPFNGISHMTYPLVIILKNSAGHKVEYTCASFADAIAISNGDIPSDFTSNTKPKLLSMDGYTISSKSVTDLQPISDLQTYILGKMNEFTASDGEGLQDILNHLKNGGSFDTYGPRITEVISSLYGSIQKSYAYLAAPDSASIDINWGTGEPWSMPTTADENTGANSLSAQLTNVMASLNSAKTNGGSLSQKEQTEQQADADKYNQDLSLTTTALNIFQQMCSKGFQN